MKSYTPLTLLVLLFPVLLSAQSKESYIWYFGTNAGIDFNSGSAVPITNGALSTYEGCATLCDTSGNLLFYTDGTDVWDRFHSIMPNGTNLRGNSSSSQSAIIVPQPGNDRLYYIFTVDDWQHNLAGGFRYSLVDMDLNGGRGDLIPANKNTLLETPVCEKVTAVKHKNERAVWVITHGFDSGSFSSYLIDDTGIDSNPVVSTVGTYIGGNQTNSRGYIKVSPDGSRLAMAVNGSGSGLNFVEVFNFDNETGLISRPMKFTDFNNSKTAYGVEFSFNSTLLYVTERFYGGRLFQYNLAAGDLQDIKDSRVELGNSSVAGGGGYGAIQLAPDGKLYAARSGRKYLDVIHEPDRVGLACEYKISGLYLNGKSSREGLPPFIQTFFLPDFTLTGGCVNDTTFFTLHVSNVDSVSWDFGDPLSGADNYSTEENPFHIYRYPGIYSVTLRAYRNGILGTRTHSTQVRIVTAELGRDTILCEGETVTLDPQAPFSTYLWSDSSNGSTLNIKKTGEYWVEIEYNGCKDRDTLNAIFNPIPEIDLGPDPLVCVGDTFHLDASYPDVDATYEWSDLLLDPTRAVVDPGTYKVSVTLDGCTFEDSILISNKPFPVVDLGNDTILCEGESLNLSVAQTGATYLWQNSSVNSSFVVQNSGTYSVEVNLNDCKSADEIEVLFNPLPIIDFGPDPTLCEGEFLLLNAANPNATYLWQDSSTDSTFIVNSGGTYTVEVEMDNCLAQEEILVTYNPLPIVDLGNDTTLCEGESLNLSVAQTGATYLWQNSSVNSSFVVQNSGTYSVEVALNDCKNSDEIEVLFNPLPIIDFGPDPTLCEGEFLLLNAANPNATYLWQDSSTDSTFIVNSGGTYTVEVEMDNCLAQEEILVTYNPLPIVDLGNDTTLCEGESLNLSVLQSGATYLWQDNSVNSDFTAQNTGTYSVEVELNDCKNTDEIEVIFNPLPTINFGPNLTLCEGDSLLLNASNPNATYLWQDGSIDPGYVVDNAGLYSVVVTMENCTRQEEILIDYNPLPIISLGNDTTLCEGESLNLSVAQPGATYLWQDNSVDSDYEVTTAGLYEVEVTINNCTSLAAIQVNYDNPPLVNLGNDLTLCEGETVLLNAEVTGATYEWQDGSGLAYYQVDNPGTYEVTVSKGVCETFESIDIFYNPLPIVDLGNDTTLCEGESLTLDATQAGATYLWQDNTTSAIQTFDQSGTYSVEITINDCKSSDEIELSFFPVPQVQFGPDTTLCEGDSLWLNASNPDASYVWQDGTLDSIYLVQDPGTYSVIIAMNNCLTTEEILVNYNPLPIVNIGPDTTLCEGENINLSAAQPGATYLWQDNSTNADFTVIQPGSYEVIVTLDNCIAADSILIDYNPLPLVGLKEESILCEGAITTLDAGQDNATYLWQDNSSDSIFVVNSEGQYWVNITIDGCSAIQEYEIAYQAYPIVDLGPDTTICEGSNYTLNVSTPDASYLWQDNSTNSAYSISEAGSYSVEVSINDCATTDEIEILTMLAPEVDLGEDVNLCEGESLILDATYEGASYLWQDGSNDATYSVGQEGWYQVAVSNKCGLIEDDFYAAYNSAPEAMDIGLDTVICPGNGVLFDVSNPNTDTYQWQDGSDDPKLVAFEEGEYTIIWSNECGSSFASRNLIYKDCVCDIYVPNAISTDGNGVNDLFKAYPACELSDYRLQVFNRWGAKLFESKDVNATWDGFFRGQKVQSGVYVWVIHYTHEFEEGIMKGDLTIVH